MRVVLQRVKSSRAIVSGRLVGKIDRGLNLLVGIADTDTEAELDWMARKCLSLRLFPAEENGNGRWEKSIEEIGGEFTLYGDCRKGRRPSFDRSAAPNPAKMLFDRFVEKLEQSGLHVQTGEFGAMMEISIENDGPVTLILERERTGGESINR